MVFNILNERVHPFEDAAKELGWEANTLLQKASEGAIIPLVYVEWEGDVRPIAEENLSPEFEAERKRLADAGHRVWPLGWQTTKSIPQLLKYKDWLTLAPGFYHSMLIKKEDSWSLITAYLFSHCAYEAPPYLHKWLIAFENNPPPQITLENLFIRDLDLRRVNSQFTQDEEGKEVRIWKIPINVDMEKFKSLFEEFEFYELLESESLQHLHEHFKEKHLRPEPVPAKAQPLIWKGTNNSLVCVVRRIRANIESWTDAPDAAWEQNHFVVIPKKKGLPRGKGLRIAGWTLQESYDLSWVESILKEKLT